MVGKCKRGEEPLRVFKLSTAPSTFNKCNHQKHSASEKRDGNSHIFANSLGASLPSLLLADGCYFEHFPAAF
jgi:hypothetical protein